MEGHSFKLLFRLVIKSQMEQIGMTCLTDENASHLARQKKKQAFSSFKRLFSLSTIRLSLRTSNESNSLSPWIVTIAKIFSVYVKREKENIFLRQWFCTLEFVVESQRARHTFFDLTQGKWLFGSCSDISYCIHIATYYNNSRQLMPEICLFLFAATHV